MTNIKNTLSRLNLLRGLLLLSLFGMPGILQFDITGVTHQFGLFNLQSFSRIAVYLSIGMIVFLFFIGIEKPRVPNTLGPTKYPPRRIMPKLSSKNIPMEGNIGSMIKRVMIFIHINKIISWIANDKEYLFCSLTYR